MSSLPGREWQHHDRGALFTEVLSLCWKHRQKDVQKDAELQAAFLNIFDGALRAGYSGSLASQDEGFGNPRNVLVCEENSLIQRE